MGALRLSHLSLGHRLLLALCAMLLPFVAVGMIGLLALQGTHQDIDRLTERYADQSRSLTALQGELRRAEASALHYTRTQDSDARERFTALALRLDGRFNALDRLEGAGQRRLAQASRRSWRVAKALATSVVLGARQPADPQGPYPLPSIQRAMKRAGANVERLAELIEREALDATNASNRREEKIFASFLAIFALGAGPALFIGWRIHRSIQRPAGLLREAAERVGAGDHRHRVSLAPGDELGEVAAAFNKMVEQMAASEAMLRRASKHDALGQLAAGVAHDFNNLLVVMLNSAHFVEAALPPGDRAREDVKEIRRAAERATRLTRQLLSFSRPLSAPREVLDLSAVVRDMQPLLARSIGEDIELDVHLVNGLAPVKGDPAQLEQVVLNLALNARDAMPEGGKLTIATRRLPPISSAKPAGVQLTVADTGYGMTSETAARALEPLFTTKPPGEGTGLGLAMVDRIVRGMGGRLDLSTEPGRGTRITVDLPATRQAVRLASPAAPAPAQSHGETILLVEDDNSVREVAKRILTRAGYSVLETASPFEALRLVAQGSQPVDLVITDVIMPRMSGPAMIEQIKARCPNLRALFLSGYPDSVMAVHRTRVNGFPLLEKPFDPDGLERHVRAALDRPKSSFSPVALAPPRS